MKSCSVDLDQMLEARERRASIQNKMLAGAGTGQCLVCLTLNIAGEVKRTPMTRMLFDEGAKEFEALGFAVEDSNLIDEPTGSEGFWLVDEEGAKVKPLLEKLEEAFPAARLFDFDVLEPNGKKLSRAVGRSCLICDRPAAECARSRSHGLEQVKKATAGLLKDFCAKKLARFAYDSLLDELYTTPKPGLVDMNNSGAHADMDLPALEKSAESLVPYFEDAARLGMERCHIGQLRQRGIRAEKEMFEATGDVNTHKGMIYSMGLLLAGMGRCLVEGGSCVAHAAELAREDSADQLSRMIDAPDTNGGAVYKKYGAKGATGEAADGFPDAVYCLERLNYYRECGCENPAALALCDSMAVLEDTNLLHRGGKEGLEYVRQEACGIEKMEPDDRIEALRKLDGELIRRNLSPGGSADMLALAFLLERWCVSSDEMFDAEMVARG